MTRQLQYVCGVLIATFVVGAAPAYIWVRHDHIRNFHVVHEGILYRSGQFSVGSLKRVIHDYRIKTVVTLRDAQREGELPPDHKEEEYCRKQEIRYFRIPQKAWDAENGAVPNEKNVHKFLAIMNDPTNHPVLVHCLAGKHRTGSMCALFRMEHDHWTNEEAIEEMRQHGYDQLDEHMDLLGYLARYQPSWITGRGFQLSTSIPHR